MYFGAPIRPNFAPTTRGFAPQQRFAPPVRGMPPQRAPMVRSAAPTVARVAPAPAVSPAAWAAWKQQRRQMQQPQVGQRTFIPAVQNAALRAEVQRLAANQGMTEAQARVLFQQMLATQAASVTPVSVSTPPAPASVPQISPGSPEADLRPTQDAADGGAAPETEAPPATSKKKFLLIGLALVAVGGIGYVMTRKKKPKAS